MSWASRRLAEIERRRAQLSARAMAQRNALASGFQQLTTPAGVVDRVVGIAQFVRMHPVLFGAGVAAVVAALRGTFVRLLPAVGRGLAAWRILRVASAWLVERQRAKRPLQGS
jgi:hypothetical protein